MRRTRPTKSRPNLLESLESRLLFTVAILSGGKSATYTDSDGDLVTVKVSAGTLNSGNFVTVPAGTVGGEYLQTIDFSGGGFDRADLTITVKKVATGDGLANVGYFNSTDHDLGNVSVAGDLGRIDAGDGFPSAPALKSLTVRSMGRVYFDNQPGGTFALISNIAGTLGSLSVKADIANAFFNIVGDTGPLTIGGSLLGAGLTVTGNMGLVKIGGDVVGNATLGSGVISSGGKIAGITLGGSLIGGSGADTGKIIASFAIGPVSIASDIVGGSASNSGYIQAATIGALSIGGSVLGGAGAHSGFIKVAGSVGATSIGGNIKGGSSTDHAGGFLAGGNIPSFSVGGSVIGSTGTFSARIELTAGTIGKFKIGGSLIGSSGGFSGSVNAPCNSVTIGGSLIGGSGLGFTAFLGCGSPSSITIGGDVDGSLGNYYGAVIACINVPRITIGGSLLGGSDDNAGLITGNELGSVTIGRDIRGGNASGTQQFNQSGCVVGYHINSLTVGGSIIAGVSTSTNALIACGAVVAQYFGSIAVKGSIRGSVGPTGVVTRAQITATGLSLPPGVVVVLKSLTVGGSVEHAYVCAGCNEAFDPSAADVQIGSVSVKGDWIASNLVAGAQNLTSGNLNFGSPTDALIPGGDPSIIASISSITIAGQVYGTPDSFSDTDHFGFVAQSIKSVNIGGVPLLLNPATDTDIIALGLTSDVNIREI